MSYQKFYSNQIHSSSLLCQLSQLWKSQILCDAIIRTGTVITKAHRLVLIAACPMLQSMENAAAGSHLEVKLSADIKQDSVNTFLQYLYEGFMMLTEDNIKDVEKIARLLQVDGVTKCCADFYKCLQASGVYIQPAGQYKYSFQDLVEFRHVRSSNVVKSAQVLKRFSDFVRPVSPGMKRPKMHSQPANISSPKEDLKSSSDPWERVPGLGLHSHSPGRHQSDPIEVMEDGLEIVQSDPVDVNKPHGQQHSTPKSVAISIASQVSEKLTDLRHISLGSANDFVEPENDSMKTSKKMTHAQEVTNHFPSSSTCNKDVEIFAKEYQEQPWKICLANQCHTDFEKKSKQGVFCCPSIGADCMHTETNHEKELFDRADISGDNKCTLNVLEEDISTGNGAYHSSPSSDSRDDVGHQDVQVQINPGSNMNAKWNHPVKTEYDLGSSFPTSENLNYYPRYSHDSGTRHPTSFQDHTGPEFQTCSSAPVTETDHHRLEKFPNKKHKLCCICRMKGVKSGRGWHIYTNYYCVTCKVPLCRDRNRNCYLEYHKSLQLH